MGRYKARPMSRQDIRIAAQGVRKLLGIHAQAYVDVLQLLETVLYIIYGEDYSVEVVPDEEIDVMALTIPDEKQILIRESVYKGAYNGNGRDRFTIMHEIAHFFLHSGMKVNMARGDEKVKAFEDPEWQADAFAGEFLMAYDVCKDMNVHEIIHCCGVSSSAAVCQYKQYQKIKKIG